MSAEDPGAGSARDDALYARTTSEKPYELEASPSRQVPRVASGDQKIKTAPIYLASQILIVFITTIYMAKINSHNWLANLGEPPKTLDDKRVTDL